MGVSPGSVAGMMKIQTETGAPSTERRQTPRLDVFGEIDGVITPPDVRVVVLDVSTGGIGIAIRRRLRVGDVHQVRLISMKGETAVIDVRVANIRESSTTTGTRYCVAGLQIIEGSDALNRLIDHLTSALSFDCT